MQDDEPLDWYLNSLSSLEAVITNIVVESALVYS